MKVLRSIKIIGMVMGIAYASLAMQSTATAGTVQGALGFLQGQGYSIKALDSGGHLVTWRAEGKKHMATIKTRNIGGPDPNSPAYGSVRLGMFFYLENAAERFSPRVINSINADLFWAKFYINENGHGVIERYEAFLQENISDELLGLRVAVYLDDFAEAWKQALSQGTS
jgi:hypothetical protein